MSPGLLGITGCSEDQCDLLPVLGVRLYQQDRQDRSNPEDEERHFYFSTVLLF